MDTNGATNQRNDNDAAVLIDDCEFYQSGVELLIDARTYVNVNATHFEECLNKASGGGALFVVTNSTILLNQCTFSYCSASGGSGGAIYVENIESQDQANLMLQNCHFDSCSSVASGGAVWIGGGDLEDSRSSYTQNHAAIGGGAIAGLNSAFPTKRSITLDDVSLKENSAGIGGALALDGYAIAVDNSTLAKNLASSSGGAAVLYDCQSILSGVVFAGNSAQYDSFGGALYINGEDGVSTANITNTNFIHNHCDASGGGAAFERASVVLEAVGFVDNYSASSGGGFVALQSDVTGTDVQFTSNTASADGGGYYCLKSTVALDTVTFDSNYARYGDAYYCDRQCTSTIEDVSNPTNDTISCN